MTVPPVRSLLTRNDVDLLLHAYRSLFPEVTPTIRDYWDLDRKRAWCSLPSDFHRARFEDYEEATRKALEIEQTMHDGVQRGKALQQISVDLGVGLSIGPGPWSDLCLLETYQQNRDKARATVLVMSDCYPIVPIKPHPVTAPLLRYGGLFEHKPYQRNGGIPKSVMAKDAVTIFLNFIPDFRPPMSPSTGSGFKAPYAKNKEGFMAVLRAIATRFDDVCLVSYGRPTWMALRSDVLELPVRLGLMAHGRSERGRGRPLQLPVGNRLVPYLPLAHPCDTRNFDAAHAEHAHLGFLALGLDGASERR